MNKKGVELSINTLVTIIIVVICLIIVLFIFSSAARQFAANIFARLKQAFGFWNATQMPQP